MARTSMETLPTVWAQKDLADVLRYVVHEQGEPIAMWIADEVTVAP